MADTVALKAKIKESGMTAKHIYGKLGISGAAFYKKMNNSTQFKPTEITILTDLLGLSRADRDSIFFAS